MNTNRRDVLATAGTALAAVLSGCRDGAQIDTDSNQDSESGIRSLPGDSSPVQEDSKLTPTEGLPGDQFGASVALSRDGKKALVGASPPQDRERQEIGRVRIFARRGDSWSNKQKITADTPRIKTFGSSVALSGDGTTALIKAVADSDADTDQEYVYVFTQSADEWSQAARLQPRDQHEFAAFGNAIAISDEGKIAIVGALAESDERNPVTGGVYIFIRDRSGWRRQQRITAADGDSFDSFGNAAAVSGDGKTAVIGAYRDEHPNGVEAGAAYVFQYTGTEWVQQAKLTASDGNIRDLFGSAVSISADGKTIIVGAQRDESPNGVDGGSIYVFQQRGGVWREQRKLAARDGNAGDQFGSSVAVSATGDVIVTGAYADETPNGEFAGSAYTFSHSGFDWHQEKKLSASDGDSFDAFGYAVAVAEHGKTIAIGARDEQKPNGDRSGAVYVF